MTESNDALMKRIKSIDNSINHSNSDTQKISFGNLPKFGLLACACSFFVGYGFFIIPNVIFIPFAFIFILLGYSSKDYLTSTLALLNYIYFLDLMFDKKLFFVNWWLNLISVVL
jgi:hypothetical protein